jgi:hypothetical protein
VFTEVLSCVCIREVESCILFECVCGYAGELGRKVMLKALAPSICKLHTLLSYALLCRVLCLAVCGVLCWSGAGSCH